MTATPTKTMRVEDLKLFIVERHMIHRRRRRGEPKPWTDDPILQQFRFCNVYRELDTVTEWITENWREPHADDPDLWFALCVARFVNWPDTLDELGYPVPWDAEHFVGVLADRMQRKEKVFTGAYTIYTDQYFNGSKSAYLAEKVFNPLWADRESLRRIVHGTLSQAHQRLIKYRGMGSFYAAQVLADLKYVKDWRTWAAPGNGCRRGLNHVMNRDKNSSWSEWEWLRCLQRLRDEIRPMLRKEIPPLHAQDLQNCLCEFDKYERVRLGEGKPRQKYCGAA